MFGTSLQYAGPLITPEPLDAFDFSILPSFCISTEEPVGFTFVYPPPTATYIESPAAKADVFTPDINPFINPIPSSSAIKVPPAITQAGILKGLPASAGHTPAIFPDVPEPVI